MASSVHRQYISLACPTGEPPLQCIEGATADQPYALRTLKRQSELRYFQQPTSVKVHNFYEMRQAALSATHGCSHEEARVLAYPKMAAAYVLGQAEANKACSRYFEATTPTEIAMKRSVDNLYMKAVNPGGVFATACTDGQTKYEAYLMQVRGKSTEFRAKQYSAAQKAAMRFASTKQALTQKGHDCSYEETIFCKYPIVAASMRPSKLWLCLYTRRNRHYAFHFCEMVLLTVSYLNVILSNYSYFLQLFCFRACFHSS